MGAAAREITRGHTDLSPHRKASAVLEETAYAMERAVLARHEEALVLPGEERSLAEVAARPAASGSAGTPP